MSVPVSFRDYEPHHLEKVGDVSPEPYAPPPATQEYYSYAADTIITVDTKSGEVLAETAANSCQGF